MTRLEMVEKIKEKTGVTYEEAKETLEKVNWDMLDAIVVLERANAPVIMDEKPDAAVLEGETNYAEPNAEPAVPAKRRRMTGHKGAGDFGARITQVLKWFGNILKKGEENFIEVTKDDETVLSLTLCSFVLLVIFLFWVMVILIALGLFTGFKFRLVGSIVGSRIINSAADKVSAKASEWKNQMKDEDDN